MNRTVSHEIQTGASEKLQIRASNKQERETMEEERMENLIEASRQVVEILQKNFHPHTTVVIEVDRIRVEETVEARVIEYAVD